MYSAIKALVKQWTAQIMPVIAQKSHYVPGNHHAGTWAIIKVSGRQHWWLASGYDLDIGHF